jgi:hypothetical protein
LIASLLRKTNYLSAKWDYLGIFACRIMFILAILACTVRASATARTPYHNVIYMHL